ncbi:hypothetical protein T440DRAFT_463924 [Plenodomus tracheiphilus IPT5]|uniref:DUF6594 domain-containing protein n=1 Tax=Plenodomus tracheiphilus IPT5 TaxID=1408161 RepID=A0A6A7BN05_9PLEO|nr:hypothetical protein T440DRAFT_463924 [Plenodomus tracheiphilus IPT5]
MGSHPEVAIFRRFGTLNAQNPLYLQAALTSLELKLQRSAKADAESNQPKRQIYDLDWRELQGISIGAFLPATCPANKNFGLCSKRAL